MGIIPDWWFGTMELYDFPFSWEWKIIPTDFHSLVFFRGVSSNHQPDLVSLIFEVGYKRWVTLTSARSVTCGRTGAPLGRSSDQEICSWGIPWRIHSAGISLLTWLGYIDGINVTIYGSTMDPMGMDDLKWYELQPACVQYLEICVQ